MWTASSPQPFRELSQQPVSAQRLPTLAAGRYGWKGENARVSRVRGPQTWLRGRLVLLDHRTIPGQRHDMVLTRPFTVQVAVALSPFLIILESRPEAQDGTAAPHPGDSIGKQSPKGGSAVSVSRAVDVDLAQCCCGWHGGCSLEHSPVSDVDGGWRE